MFRDHPIITTSSFPVEQRRGSEPVQAYTSSGPSADPYEMKAPADSEETQRVQLLYEQFWRPLHLYIYRLLGNWDDAADVTQEVFLRTYISWKSLRDEDNRASWLYRIATNLCIDQLRHRKRISWWPLGRRSRYDESSEEGRDDENFSFLPPNNGGIPEVAEREHIRLTLAQLPEHYATPLLLNIVMDISYKEIAELLDISPASAAVRISRAKRMFFEQYQQLGQEAMK